MLLCLLKLNPGAVKAILDEYPLRPRHRHTLFVVECIDELDRSIRDRRRQIWPPRGHRELDEIGLEISGHGHRFQYALHPNLHPAHRVVAPDAKNLEQRGAITRGSTPWILKARAEQTPPELLALHQLEVKTRRLGWLTSRGETQLRGQARDAAGTAKRRAHFGAAGAGGYE